MIYWARRHWPLKKFDSVGIKYSAMPSRHRVMTALNNFARPHRNGKKNKPRRRRSRFDDARRHLTGDRGRRCFFLCMYFKIMRPCGIDKKWYCYHRDDIMEIRSAKYLALYSYCWRRSIDRRSEAKACSRVALNRQNSMMRSIMLVRVFDKINIRRSMLSWRNVISIAVLVRLRNTRYAPCCRYRDWYWRHKVKCRFLHYKNERQVADISSPLIHAWNKAHGRWRIRYLSIENMRTLIDTICLHYSLFICGQCR